MTAAKAPSRDAGFTLVECLVALLVLAIAAAGLIGAAQAHIDATEGLRARTYARWVAENRLAELQLALPAAQERKVAMMGTAFVVSAAWSRTADPDLAAVVVTVARPGRRQADAIVRGFVDRRTTTP